MTRAEEAAMEAYPNAREYGCDTPYNPDECRRAYIDGYKQAEKDLALTTEDIKMIDDILIRIDRVPNVDMSRKEFYEEVLRRFKEDKK